MPGTIEPREAIPLLPGVTTGGTPELGQVRTAARFTLRELTQRCPGHSIEVRVSLAGAVQIGRKPARRRGTPPSVVEMEVGVFLSLVADSMTWNDVERSKKATASGVRADLGPCFLLFIGATSGRWAE